MNLPCLRIGLIEDNDDLRDELLFFLRHKEYSVWGAASAEAFWRELHRNPVDIVLVDLGLPGEDGFSVVHYLHNLASYGVVVLTARGGEQERLRGLNLGADLFLVKPVNFARLDASLRALGLRLQRGAIGQEGSPVRMDDPLGQWRLGGDGLYVIGPQGQRLALSLQEFGLLKILMRSANQIFSKEALHDLLFQHADSLELHRIEVILSRLRRKAKDQGASLPIRSVFGKGIVFTGPVQESAARAALR